MNKALTIARWEFNERIKRKSFLVSMFLVPIIIVVISMLPSLLIVQGDDAPIAVGIVDLTKKYEKEFSLELTKNFLDDGQPAFFAFNLAARGIGRTSLLKFADKQVLSDGIFGYVIIEEDPDLKLTFRSKDIFNPDKLNLIANYRWSCNHLYQHH